MFVRIFKDFFSLLYFYGRGLIKKTFKYKCYLNPKMLLGITAQTAIEIKWSWFREPFLDKHKRLQSYKTSKLLKINNTILRALDVNEKS